MEHNMLLLVVTCKLMNDRISFWVLVTRNKSVLAPSLQVADAVHYFMMLRVGSPPSPLTEALQKQKKWVYTSSLCPAIFVPFQGFMNKGVVSRRAGGTPETVGSRTGGRRRNQGGDNIFFLSLSSQLPHLFAK